jgi:hypothetical protein
MMKRKKTKPDLGRARAKIHTCSRGQKKRTLARTHGNKRDTLGRRRSRILDGFRKWITGTYALWVRTRTKKQRKSPRLNQEIPEKKKNQN